MGYHVTILRTKGDEAIPISAQEFREAASKMPELKLDEQAVEKPVAEILHEDGPNWGLFWSEDGTISAKNPAPDDVEVMLKLASLLNARVRGGEFETYRSIDEVYQHPDDEHEMEKVKQWLDAGRAKSKRESQQFQVKLILFAIVISVIFAVLKQLMKRF